MTSESGNETVNAGELRSSELRILIVRADRLGDVILSTPVFEVIRRHYPHAKISVLVRSFVAPLLRGLSSVDEVLIYDPEGTHAGIRGLWRLRNELRAKGFRIALVLQSQFKLASAIALAGIRYRIGPLSKIHSFFFYNRGMRQRRSQVEMHEADYNLHLLRKLGIRVGSRSVPVSVHLKPEAREAARTWLEARGWDTSKPLIAVHPGMGGSALNWPENHYCDFIRTLLSEGRQVVVTGGKGEWSLLGRISEGLGAMAQKAWIYRGGGSDVPFPDIEGLAGLLSWADLMVVPSTGPLHLAVALGRPVVTFFSPIRVQSALRWGPYLPDESRISVLVPENYCGQDFKCRGQLCNYYPCMKSLTVAQALEQATLQLRHFEGKRE